MAMAESLETALRKSSKARNTEKNREASFKAQLRALFRSVGIVNPDITKVRFDIEIQVLVPLVGARISHYASLKEAYAEVKQNFFELKANKKRIEPVETIPGPFVVFAHLGDTTIPIESGIWESYLGIKKKPLPLSRELSKKAAVRARQEVKKGRSAK